MPKSSHPNPQTALNLLLKSGSVSSQLSFQKLFCLFRIVCISIWILGLACQKTKIKQKACQDFNRDFIESVDHFE